MPEEEIPVMLQIKLYKIHKEALEKAYFFLRLEHEIQKYMRKHKGKPIDYEPSYSDAIEFMKEKGVFKHEMIRV